MRMSRFSDQIKILLDQQERLYERQSELQALLEASKDSAYPVNGASNAEENWSGIFEWDSRANDVRFNIFGISTYRANQREVTSVSGLFFFKFPAPLFAIILSALYQEREYKGSYCTLPFLLLICKQMLNKFMVCVR